MKISRFRGSGQKLSFFVGLFALSIFGWYIWNNRDQYQELLDLSPLIILALSALTLGTSISNGIINRLLFRAFDIYLGLVEAIDLALASTLANQLPISGGLMARGLYLKKRYGLSYTYYASATLALYILFLVASGLLGLVVTLLIIIKESTTLTLASPLLAGFSGMLLPAALLLLSPAVSWFPARVRPHIHNIYQGWGALRANYLIPLLIAATHLISSIFIATRFWIAFQALSQNVTPFECVLFSVGTILTQLFSFAPGELGVREGIVAIISALLGLEPGIAVIAVAFDRVVSTTIIIGLGVISTYRLGRSTGTT